MNTRLFNSVLVLVCLIGGSIAASAQAGPAKPVAFTTAPKLVVAKLKSGDQEVYDVRGKVTFTVTAANSDDTVAGILNYSIPDDARQKIASLSGKAINTIPATFTRKDVLAGFQKGTAAPIVHLEISPIEADLAGVKMAFNRMTVDINGREGGTIPTYTKEEMEALFTVWARQINTNRARRGVIARMNKVITGEPEQQNQ